MTNPTRQEILRAYAALTSMCELVERRAGYRPTEHERAILKALPPQPLPTMADVEWDDDKHYLAEAEHQEYGLVTMIGPTGIRGYIQCAFRNDDGINTVFVNRDYLTPTGRRYTLTEVQE